VYSGSKHILSFGGGVNTAALMVLLLQEGSSLDEVVFADTGSEVPETYGYLYVAQEYLAKFGLSIRVIRRPNGESIYETCSRRKVIPSAVWRWSTRDFKVNPIHAYYRSLGVHIYQYLGIAYDEVERMRDSQVSYVTNLYPLVDAKLTRSDCVRVIEDAGLPKPAKSGCFFCPFNSRDRWAWLLEAHPDLYTKAVALEERSKHYPNQRLTDQIFRNRDAVPLREYATILKNRELAGEEEALAPCGASCMT